MRKFVAIVAGILAVLAVFAQPAAASPSGKGSGTGQLTNEVYTPIGTVDGDTY